MAVFFRRMNGYLRGEQLRRLNGQRDAEHLLTKE
jgi:hypothetical protein